MQRSLIPKSGAMLDYCLAGGQQAKAGPAAASTLVPFRRGYSFQQRRGSRANGRRCCGRPALRRAACALRGWRTSISLAALVEPECFPRLPEPRTPLVAGGLPVLMGVSLARREMNGRYSVEASHRTHVLSRLMLARCPWGLRADCASNSAVTLAPTAGCGSAWQECLVGASRYGMVEYCVV